MRIHIERNKRNALIGYSILLMLLCLFISRAALSVSMIIFLALTLVHKNLLLQLRSFIQNKFLLSISLLFFIPFVSYFWSNNTTEWLDISRIKIPLLLFPVAFAGSWQLTTTQWKTIANGFLVIVFLATVWSFGQYLLDIEGFNEGYLRSKTILTPLEDDHVRFSWLVSFAVLLCLVLIHLGSRFKMVYIQTMIFFDVYLHVLSERMGLFSFYILLFMYASWLLLKQKNTKLSLIALAGLLLLPLISWWMLPTFRHRIQYFLYDLSFVRNDTYVSGSNDGTRIQSLKAGWALLKENPLGVGAGDLKASIFTWYKVHVPAMQPGEMFLPCSEWLVYGGFAGWPAVILLSVIMAIPFFIKDLKHRMFWVTLHTITAFSFIFDMIIEAQYGVFIYSIIVLWWWKWFQINKQHES